MATTTNYGWTTPDDTALVKDGASAIRTLGTSVDTTTKNLNPSTTLGDIEYRSSTSNVNTRVGIGTSGQALTVVAGAPSWAASPTSVLTTTGDSLYASAANTLARLGIGSTGQVLTVASGLPSWATPASGSMTLISTTTLSGTSVTLSSIPATYKNINVVIFGITNNTGAQNIRINANASATLAFYASVDNNGGTVGTPVFSDASIQTNRSMSNTLTTNIHNLTIQNYASTTAYKSFDFNGGYAVTGAIYYSFNTAGAIKTTSAISSIQITSDNGYTFTAGTVLLYGVN